jgi:hypothetical protein
MGHIANIQVFTHHPVLNQQHEDLNISPSTNSGVGIFIQNFKYYAIRLLSKNSMEWFLSAPTTIVS